MAKKKANKKKKTGKNGKTEVAAFLGAVLSQAIGQVLGDAVEVAAKRLKKVKKAKKKRHHAAAEGDAFELPNGRAAS